MLMNTVILVYDTDLINADNVKIRYECILIQLSLELTIEHMIIVSHS